MVKRVYTFNNKSVFFLSKLMGRFGKDFLLCYVSIIVSNKPKKKKIYKKKPYSNMVTKKGSLIYKCFFYIYLCGEMC